MAKKKGAIATDAPQVEKTEGKVQYEDPRAEAMKAVEARRREELLKEGHALEEDIPPDTKAETEPETKEETVTSDEPPPDKKQDTEPEDPPPVFKKNGVWMTLVKVDGEEVEAPIDQVKASYQKHDTADRRLREAAEERKRIAEERVQLEQEKQTRQQAPAQRPDGEPSDKDAHKDVQEKARKFLQKLYEGDEDDAVAMMADLLAQPKQVQQATGLDAKAVMDIASRVAEERDLAREHKAAVSWFQREYKDVWTDPVLKDIADRQTEVIYQTDPTKSMQDIMKEAGDYVRQWKQSISPSDGLEARRAAKRQMDEVPAQAARAQVGNDEPKPQTMAEKIAELKAARGQ